VVSCLGDVPAAVKAQEALLDASLAVGVKRYIPSEFGSDTTNPRVKSYPFFAAKLKHQHRLRQVSTINEDFSYSLLITGPFLDWGLSTVPFIINVGARTAEGNVPTFEPLLGTIRVPKGLSYLLQLTSLRIVIDGGDVPFSITCTSAVGDAVAAILTRPQDTANRAIFVHEGVTTQNTLIAHAERLLSSAGKGSSLVPTFSVTSIDSELAERAAWKAFHRPSADPLEWALPFINLSIWSGREICHFVDTDNELLGIRVLEGTELDALLREGIARAAKVYGLAERCTRSEVLEAEARACRAMEAGKGLLCVDDRVLAGGCVEMACEVGLE
jgi:hypothetical protein